MHVSAFVLISLRFVTWHSIKKTIDELHKKQSSLELVKVEQRPPRYTRKMFHNQTLAAITSL